MIMSASSLVTVCSVINPRRITPVLFGVLASVLCVVGQAVAAPPDLTNGEVPTSTRTQNLGPTGMRG